MSDNSILDSFQQERVTHELCNAAYNLSLQFQKVAEEVRRPSVLYRPGLVFTEEQTWRAQYGEFCAYGDSPDEAMRAFDKMWSNE